MAAITYIHPAFFLAGVVVSKKMFTRLPAYRDPHNMTVCHTLDTHSGTLSDFDMNGHHLVTCGFARRHGNLQAVDR